MNKEMKASSMILFKHRFMMAENLSWGEIM